MDLTVAADFPKSEYMEVERRLSVYLQGLGVDAATVQGFEGYAGGWNAVIMRFCAADDDRSAVAALLASYQGGGTNEQRYEQERQLLSFFVNAQSAIESCCFGIYHIGRLKNAAFNRSEDEVTPAAARSEFEDEYPGSKLASELAKLVRDAMWKDIKRIRVILFHRMHPGTTIYLSLSGSATPPRPAEWTGRGVVLEPSLVNGPRAWLATEVSTLVAATLDFVKTNF